MSSLRFAARVWLGVSLGWWVSACSSSTSSPAPAVDPLDAACAQIAHDQCSALQGCCAAAGFDTANCEAGVRARCAPLAADVRNGKSHYDAFSANACAAEEQAVFAQCDLSLITYSYASSADLVACQQIFSPGNSPPGGACMSDQDCAPISRDATLVYCDSDDNLCDIIHILAAGDACVSSEGGGVVELCGHDLYCSHDTGPASGHCIGKTKIGEPCAGSAVAPCVADAYCDGTAGVCTALKDGGAACVSPTECKSLSCTQAACADAVPFLDADVCAGNNR